MVRIYFAGPLFCESEKKYNTETAKILRSEGFDTVLPQDEGCVFDEGKMSDPDYADRTAVMVFETDLALLDSCDTVVINLDGRVPDEGACVEIGYAYAKGKRIFGLKTDVRASEYGMDNLMISGMLSGRIAHSVPELVSMLRKS